MHWESPSVFLSQLLITPLANGLQGQPEACAWLKLFAQGHASSPLRAWLVIMTHKCLPRPQIRTIPRCHLSYVWLAETSFKTELHQCLPGHTLSHLLLTLLLQVNLLVSQLLKVDTSLFFKTMFKLPQNTQNKITILTFLSVQCSSIGYKFYHHLPPWHPRNPGFHSSLPHPQPSPLSVSMNLISANILCKQNHTVFALIKV